METRAAIDMALDPEVVYRGGQDRSSVLSSSLALTVPLTIEAPCRTTSAQPVTVGVPFPRGTLTRESILSLTAPSGHHLPVQTKPLGLWPDRSIKWLLVDFLCGPVVQGPSPLSLECHSSDPLERTLSGESLRVDVSDDRFRVSTGAASFTLDRRRLAPLTQVEINDQPILDMNRSVSLLTDRGGWKCVPQVQLSEVETEGPVRATILFKGFFKRHADRCRFHARISFFAGLPLVKIDFTVHNPRRARHRGGLWDLGDPGSLFFRDLSLQLGLAADGSRQVQWSEDQNERPRTTDSSRFEIYQDSSGGENWQSPNHVNRQGRNPARFRGYRVRHDGIESYSLRASPVVACSGGGHCITAGIPEFWQQFPKAIDIDDGQLNLRLFPGQSEYLHELQGGEQKTHTIWLHFGAEDLDGIDSLSFMHRPARVHCPPGWYRDTRAIPRLSTGSASLDERFATYVSELIDGPDELRAGREIIDEYGWRNYGEVYADHENEFYPGQKPLVSHYNNQYDLVLGMLLQYLSATNLKWFELCDALARHVMDIDIYRTSEDKAAYNGGLFWHTDHYRDAATATHRCYSRMNCGSVGRSYGGGPCNEHNYTTGLLYYYFLTGNPHARATVLGLAEWVIAMDDGRRTLLGLIDQGATGRASCTTEPDYHGPGRGCGNSVNALLDAWLLTSVRGYLIKAEELIRRVAHPETDIDVLDLLNVERRGPIRSS